MTLIKHRHYTEVPETALSSIVGTSSSPLLVTHHTAPVATTDSFLGLRCEFNMSVAVSASGAPPEKWWTVTTVTLIAGWTPTGSSAVLPIFGTSEHYLGSRLLTPRLTPSPSSPGDYYVQWSTDDLPLETDTSRKDVTATAGPSINVGIAVYDPYTALDGTYTTIDINYDCRLFTLWGSIP